MPKRVALALLRGAVLAVELGAGVGAVQAIDDADALGGILDVDDRPVILRRDLDGRVLGRGGRPADQERDRRSLRAPSTRATCTISSSDGVIRPERPIMSTLRSRACLRISSQGIITPRSITS